MSLTASISVVVTEEILMFVDEILEFVNVNCLNFRL